MFRYLLDVLKECRVLLLAKDAVAKWTGESLHTSVHVVNEVKLDAQQSVVGLLLASLGSVHSLERRKKI